jgi:hypothetical protein
MDSYGNNGFKGISIRRADVSSLFSKNIRTKKLSVTESTVLSGYLNVNSKYTLGISVRKDMGNENYTSEFDPFDLQEELFPNMADFTDENILIGDKTEDDRLIASYWDDLGNDVFDDWGYFFIYNVVDGKYYFPILSPQNEIDGVLTTQTFTVFSKTFTIIHGWCAFGIFKIDITCSDETFAFRFGAYGDLGSDGDEDDYDMTTLYGNNNKTLYYHHHAEQGNLVEVLYSYFIPKNESDNNSKPYTSLYNPDDTEENSLITKSITNGIIIYFSKGNDVKNWVINDILTGDFSLTKGDITAEGDIISSKGNIYSNGSIISKGDNLGRRRLIRLNDEDYLPDASTLINGYFRTQENLTNNRTFEIPSVENIINAIPNCQDGTSFKFTINNKQDDEYSWNIISPDVQIDDSVINTDIEQNRIVSYIIIITSVSDTEAILLQETELHPIFFP